MSGLITWLGKIRPNVVILSLVGAALTAYIAGKLIGLLGELGIDGTIAVVALLSMIVGIGIGNLYNIASQVATDPTPPPPPTVPADVHASLMSTLLWRLAAAPAPPTEKRE